MLWYLIKHRDSFAVLADGGKFPLYVRLRR